MHVDGCGRVVCVQISPINGSINLTVREGSSVLVRNEKRHKSVIVEVDCGQVFRIGPVSEKFVGWTNPFDGAVVEAKIVIGDEPPVMVPLTKTGWREGCVRVDPGEEPQSIVIVVEHGRVDTLFRSQTFVPPKSPFRLEFFAKSVGLSVASAGRELLSIELALVRALVVQDLVFRRVSLLVSDVQIDTGVSKNDSHPVVLVNSGTQNAFLEAFYESSLEVSLGVAVIPTVSVQFDTLFVEVDSDFMSAMDEFLNGLLGTEIGIGSTTTSLQTRALQRKLRPIHRGTVCSIPVPSILVLDSLQVSVLDISLWVDFALSSMMFLPVSLKLVIGVLSLGGSFKLDGSHVIFRRRDISNFKGTSVHFAQALVQDYGGEALRNIAALLGSSSLLTIPRAPIQLVAGMGGAGLERVTKAIGDFGHAIADFASDTKYRQAQAKIREGKKIKGFADGFAEGANRLGEGAEGILDVFKKPVSGAKSGGIGGFLVGIGTGLVGTFVKPVTKLGEAFGDMGTGIARSVQSSSSSRPRYARRRPSRAFYGSSGAVREYSERDAFLYSALPELRGFELVVPLLNHPPHIPHLDLVLPPTFAADEETAQMLLVLFETKLVSVSIEKNQHTVSEPAITLSPSRRASIVDVGPGFSQARVVVEIPLRQIRDARVSIETKSVYLTDAFGVKAQFYLDLPASPKAGELLRAFANAVANGVGKGGFDWREARQLFTDAQQLGNRHPEENRQGIKKCQVIEVERFLMTYGWRTPFLMLDSNTGWRWVDQNMQRHSKIRQKLKRSEAAKFKTPPIDFGDIWTPIDEWQVEVDPDTTDKDGWQYALSFNSSTWQKHSGITASVRKRTWTRNYR